MADSLDDPLCPRCGDWRELSPPFDKAARPFKCELIKRRGTPPWYYCPRCEHLFRPQKKRSAKAYAERGSIHRKPPAGTARRF